MFDTYDGVSNRKNMWKLLMFLSQSMAEVAAHINSADGQEATKREFEANETCTTGVD